MRRYIHRTELIACAWRAVYGIRQEYATTADLRHVTSARRAAAHFRTRSDSAAPYGDHAGRGFLLRVRGRTCTFLHSCYRFDECLAPLGNTSHERSPRYLIGRACSVSTAPQPEAPQMSTVDGRDMLIPPVGRSGPTTYLPYGRPGEACRRFPRCVYRGDVYTSTADWDIRGGR
jgi:hypothetical protein